MASSVFFKFKSQKEPTRVEFDGTGISVFELKREIILRSGLGDGTDFDLVICADEGMKEGMYSSSPCYFNVPWYADSHPAVYDDDTTIIPRSTTVIARRMPPKVPGRGGAARYVSGKMPVHAKNSSRREQIAKPVVKTQSNTLAQLSSAMTEEEKMAAVFQAQTENFTSREEEMATYVIPSAVFASLRILIKRAVNNTSPREAPRSRPTSLIMIRPRAIFATAAARKATGSNSAQPTTTQSTTTGRASKERPAFPDPSSRRSTRQQHWAKTPMARTPKPHPASWSMLTESS